MLKTKLCELFGIEYPIISAGMGAIAMADLAAAVSAAGGLGTLGLGVSSREGIQIEVAAARSRTDRPLAANLIVPFLRPGIVAAVARLPIQVLTFFWGDARDHVESIRIARDAGIKAVWQCGSADEARWAKEAGCDAVMAHFSGSSSWIRPIPPDWSSASWPNHGSSICGSTNGSRLLIVSF